MSQGLRHLITNDIVRQVCALHRHLSNARLLPSLLGGCWENVNFYCPQGTSPSLSWLKMELIGHWLEVLTAWPPPQLWRFYQNLGRSITSRGKNSVAVSASLQCSPFPEAHGVSRLPVSTGLLIISDKSSRSLQGQGALQPALSRGVLAICLVSLRGSANWQDPIWGKRR